MTIQCLQDKRIIRTQLKSEIETLRERVAELESLVREHGQSTIALKESKQRLEKIIEFLPDAAFAIDLDKKIIAWNKAIEKMTGLKAEDMMGKGNYEYALPFYGIRRPMLIDFVLRPDKEMESKYVFFEKNGGVFLTETVVSSVKGEKRVLRGKAGYLYDGNGDITGAIESIGDITEQKLTEETLIRSEKLYRSVIENMKDTFYRTDREGHLVMVSPSGPEAFGFGCVDEMLGLNIAESLFVNPKEMELLLWEIEKQGFVKDYEVRIRRRDGTFMDVSTSSRQYFDENEVLLGIEGIFRDITGRKRVEDEMQRLNAELQQRVAERTEELVKANKILKAEIGERRRTEEALRESEQKLYDIVDFLPEATFAIDPHGRVVIWNRAIEEMTGIKSGDMVGKGNYEYALPFYGVRRPILIDMVFGFDKKIEEKYLFVKKEGDVMFVEAEVPTAGGSRFLWGKARPLHDSKGNIIGAIESIRDITEHKKLEYSLYQAQKMQAIGTLAGGIAHDFNNMLGVIIGYADIARTGVYPERHQHYLDEILRSCDRAKNLVNQILNFSRPQEQEKKPVLIAPIIKEGVKLLRSSLPSTIEIIQSIPDTPITALADPTQIHQVLMNLCTNAAHAMRDEGGILTVQLDNERIDSSGTYRHLGLKSGNYARLTVNDTGCGIDASVIDRIFDPFFTTKGPGDGTGLGLSVVYGIVKNYGGAIEVSSEPGKGTTFCSYIPLIDIAPEIEENVSDLLPGGSERILFVDDEAALVEVVRMMLMSLGYHVTSRTSSIEALEAFRSRPQDFDLVITDMTMPNMTGADLVKVLLRIRPEIPTILCTGFNERISEENAKKLGIRRFVMKPLFRKDFAFLIRDVLDKR